MFPLKSLAPSERLPIITWFLMLCNIAVFAYMIQGNLSFLLYLDFGIVPIELGLPDNVVPFYKKVYQFFTYMFLHGGWFHLILNCYFLYVFGNSVENRLGHRLYFISYICFGLIAGMVYVFVSPTSGVPMVGASGAIAGVMGAYLVFFPLSKIKTLLVVIIFITIVNIPAIIFIGLWFALQVAGGIFLGTSGVDAGTAWWAHIGGFVAGCVFALLIRIMSFFKYQSKKGEQIISDCRKTQ